MRYVKNDLFTNHVGKPFRISDPEAGIPEHEGTVGEVIHLHLNFYDINHAAFASRQTQILSQAETRSFNRCMEILTGEAQDGLYYRFETEDFKVVQKVLGWIAPLTPWWRDGPLLEDLLGSALERLPLEVLEKMDRA